MSASFNPRNVVNGQVLPPSFYARDTRTVARELLGKLLVRDVEGRQLWGRIGETEAYVGEHDNACHASRGRTARTEVMFGPPGRAYVYLIYGMYDMLNLVTEADGYPAAVLLRGAGEWTGPGKLTRGLGIDRTLNRHDVTTREALYVVDDGVRVADSDMEQTARIGVAYAGEDALLPWRFVVK